MLLFNLFDKKMFLDSFMSVPLVLVPKNSEVNGFVIHFTGPSVCSRMRDEPTHVQNFFRKLWDDFYVQNIVEGLTSVSLREVESAGVEVFCRECVIFAPLDVMPGESNVKLDVLSLVRSVTDFHYFVTQAEQETSVSVVDLSFDALKILWALENISGVLTHGSSFNLFVEDVRKVLSSVCLRDETAFVFKSSRFVDVCSELASSVIPRVKKYEGAVSSSFNDFELVLFDKLFNDECYIIFSNTFFKRLFNKARNGFPDDSLVNNLVAGSFLHPVAKHGDVLVFSYVDFMLMVSVLNISNESVFKSKHVLTETKPSEVVLEMMDDLLIENNVTLKDYVTVFEIVTTI